MGPFTIIPEWVLDNTDLPHGAVRLYGVLGRYADSDGLCWPARGTLAKRLNCSTDTVDRWVNHLIKAGAITVYKRKSENSSVPNLTNHYVVNRGRSKDAAGGVSPIRHRMKPNELDTSLSDLDKMIMEVADE